MADFDATLVQNILDMPQRQRKANIQHDCEADDLGAAVKALERVCFRHEHRLRKHSAALNPIPSGKASTDHNDGGEAENAAKQPDYQNDLNRLTRLMLRHRMKNMDHTLSRMMITKDGPRQKQRHRSA